MSQLWLFDFDGVIADSLVCFQAALDRACRQAGLIAFSGREEFLAMFDGNMVDGLNQAGLPPCAVPATLARLRAEFAVVFTDVPAFPGIAATLQRLGGAHPLYVITSNVSAVVTAALHRYGVTQVRAVLGADVNPCKVDKIRRTRAHHPEARAFYVGDTVGDMIEGQKAGATTIGAAWGWHGAERLRGGDPDHVIGSPADLERIAFN